MSEKLYGYGIKEMSEEEMRSLYGERDNSPQGVTTVTTSSISCVTLSSAPCSIVTVVSAATAVTGLASYKHKCI